MIMMHPPPNGQPYPVPVYLVPRPPTSGFAVASLVLGIIGVFGGWCAFGLPCLMAVVLGHIGLAETKHGKQRGHEAAFWGVMLGYIVLIPAWALGLIFFSSRLQG